MNYISDQFRHSEPGEEHLDVKEEPGLTGSRNDAAKQAPWARCQWQADRFARHSRSNVLRFCEGRNNLVAALPDFSRDQQVVSPQKLHEPHSPWSRSIPDVSESIFDISALRTPQSNEGQPIELKPLQAKLWIAEKSVSPEDEYKPRQRTGKRKSSTRRIPPKSARHAQQLERNRVAATKCRDRHKNYVESLQQRCRDEETRREIQRSLALRLHEEVRYLRNELLKYHNCDCNNTKEFAVTMTR